MPLRISAFIVALLVFTSVSSQADLPPERLAEAARAAYTPEALSAYDGTDPDLPIYVALRGIVFDVSQGRDFYVPGGHYHLLAGRDASCAVARMSMEPDDLSDRCDDLDEAQIRALDQLFDGVFLAKYPIVGHVAGGWFFPTGICCDEAGCRACVSSTTHTATKEHP